MSSNPSDQDSQADSRADVQNALTAGATQDDAGESNAAADTAGQSGPQPGQAESAGRRRILIGSQRDPAAYRARRTRDWTPLPEADAPDATTDAPAKSKEETAPVDSASVSAKQSPAEQEQPPEPKPPEPKPPEPEPSEPEPSEPEPPRQQASEPAATPAESSAEEAAPPAAEDPHADVTMAQDVAAKRGPDGRFPLPNLRDNLSPDLEREFDAALGDESLEELFAGDDPAASQSMLEEDSLHTGRVVAVRRDDVFVELGSREQGCVSVRQFQQPPEIGTSLEVKVRRFNPEDGLYELAIPGTAMSVDDWDDIEEGMLIEARVTGHNTGGLECEVNRLRGFIPVSQIALYRVEDLAQFVDEKFICLVTEANPERRNLVLSRRAVLEREKEEARQKMLESLQPGQIHEGVVRKLVDFGAFVDIGGMDGLLHISQLGWGRVEHPSEVLSEGQTIKVKIQKIDHDTGKMSLAYRDLMENPWDSAEKKFPANTEVEGTVTKLMEFGAFVELEPGVEGLVHISELAHKRVWRTSDVVHEGEKVKVMVLSVDSQAQRISLSIRQTYPDPEPKKKDDDEPTPLPEKKAKRKGPQEPLTGGLGKSSGGAQFGLEW